MQYITLVGDYLTAYHFCLENGGQLFTGNGKDSANVCLIGQKCYTFWVQNSKRKQEVNDLCQYFNIDSEGMTGGRLARWVIDDLISIPYEDTYWSKTYRNLAKQGSHWHYMHCDCKQSFWGIEVDLKSAYFASLFSFPSLLFQPGLGYLDDKGAMDNLKEIYPDFPKWFRLQFLGCLSSWRIFYLCRDKSQPRSQELIKRIRYCVKYNAAFNVAHRAILRNYKIMQKIHKIGGKYIRRIHTDSFFLDYDIPEEKENELWEYIQSKNLRYTIKGFGRTFFWDINTGFIGNKFVGAKIDVTENMRKDNIKMKSEKTNETVLSKDSVFVKTAESIVNSRGVGLFNSVGDARQIELFSMESYSDSSSPFEYQGY